MKSNRSGGRQPNFTREFLGGQGLTRQPARFSRFDGLAVALVGIAAAAWTVQPESTATGWIGPSTGLPTHVVLGSAAACWSGAYLLFSVVYGPFLLRPSLDE